MWIREWRLMEEAGGDGGEGSSAPPAQDIVVTGGPPPAEGQDQAGAETSGENSGDEAPPKQPGKDRLQKRFSELTRTIYEERARRESLEREIGELKAKAAPPPEIPGSKAPKLEDFKDYEEYAEARARWVAGEEIRKVTTENQQRNSRERAQQTAVEIRTRWDTAEAEAKGELEDYDEVMASTEVRFSESVAIALLDSPSGPRLAYYLKSHPDEARKLAGLSPVAAAREIGKLEAGLTKAPAPKPKTSAPPPPKPENRGRQAEADLYSPNIPIGDYIRRRNKEIAERRRNG